MNEKDRIEEYRTKISSGELKPAEAQRELAGWLGCTPTAAANKLSGKTQDAGQRDVNPRGASYRNDERKDQNTMNYYARKSSGGQGIICDEDTGRTVAVVYDDKDMALLAAAPALLAALEYAMREVEGYEQRTGAHQFCHWITTARGAIAQAKEEG